MQSTLAEEIRSLRGFYGIIFIKEINLRVKKLYYML